MWSLNWGKMTTEQNWPHDQIALDGHTLKQVWLVSPPLPTGHQVAAGGAVLFPPAVAVSRLWPGTLGPW